jgi:hypothetical protein
MLSRDNNSGTIHEAGIPLLFLHALSGLPSMSGHGRTTNPCYVSCCPSERGGNNQQTSFNRMRRNPAGVMPLTGFLAEHGTWQGGTRWIFVLPQGFTVKDGRQKNG